MLGVKDDLIVKKIDEILASENIKVEPITKEEIKNATSILVGEKMSFKKFNDKLILALVRRKKVRNFNF